MKKKFIFISLFLMVLFISLNVQAFIEEPLKEKELDVFEPKGTDTKPLSEFTEEDAIAKVIDYHNNSSPDDFNVPNFPINIKKGEIVTKDYLVGGFEENKMELEIFVDIKRKMENEEYIVTLTRDYNITINDEYRLSYWTYVVSTEGLKLIDSKNNGLPVRL